LLKWCLLDLGGGKLAQIFGGGSGGYVPAINDK